MKTKEKNTGLNGPVPAKENKKHSKTWLAMQKLKGGKILDMKAVLK